MLSLVTKKPEKFQHFTLYTNLSHQDLIQILHKFVEFCLTC